MVIFSTFLMGFIVGLLFNMILPKDRLKENLHLFPYTCLLTILIMPLLLSFVTDISILMLFLYTFLSCLGVGFSLIFLLYAKRG